jgi:Protein of unknown function (DUF4238)
MQNPPTKHHYIPEFYLKSWADDNGQICRFNRPYKSVVCRKVYTSEVGFVHSLYSVPGVKPELAQKIETDWFRLVDQKGSDALQKLFTSPNAGWDSESRTAWTRFMMSIAHRTPDNLEAFKESIGAIWAQEVPNIQARYEKLKKPDDPDRYEDYARSKDPLVVEKSAIRAIQGAINNPKTGQFINNMHWRVIDLSCSRFSLLTSDSPLVISNGLQKLDGHLAMPLSPTKLFIATYRPEFMREFEQLSAQQLARKMNELVVGRAKRFVVDNSRKQESFITSRFGTDHTPSLMMTIRDGLR